MAIIAKDENTSNKNIEIYKEILAKHNMNTSLNKTKTMTINKQQFSHDTNK